jgi:nucleotide-binding universal stress UspA family protein
MEGIVNEMKRRRISPGSKLPRLLFTNVLVPIDGSKNSKRAVRTAAAIAKRFRARLFVIHAVQTPVYLYTGEMASPFIGEYMDFEEGEARKMVKQAVLLAKSHGVDARGQVVTDVASIVEAITDFAATKKH